MVLQTGVVGTKKCSLTKKWRTLNLKLSRSHLRKNMRRRASDLENLATAQSQCVSNCIASVLPTVSSATIATATTVTTTLITRSSDRKPSSSVSTGTHQHLSLRLGQL